MSREIFQRYSRNYSWSYPLSHLARAAFRAIIRRCSGVNLAARALPPFIPPRRPSATAAGFFPLGASCGASPVASLATRKAISFTSSGPCLPLLDRLGIVQHSTADPICPEPAAKRLFCLTIPAKMSSADIYRPKRYSAISGRGSCQLTMAKPGHFSWLQAQTDKRDMRRAWMNVVQCVRFRGERLCLPQAYMMSQPTSLSAAAE
jgi:hypothetical protein